MRIKRPLAPAFINRLDEYLLLNKPEIWSARTHLVLYYGILFMAVLAAIAFIVPDDPRTSSPAGFWVGFVSLISLVSLVGWLIYLLRFNVFKRYGLTSPLNRFLTFILYFVSIGTFVLFCYVEPYVETVRANAAYTDDEIVNDVNKINVNITRLEYDSLGHKWQEDTVLVTKRDLYDYTGIPLDEDGSPVIELINPETFNIRIREADSMRKINDSMYVFLQPPLYTLLYASEAGRHSSIKQLSSLDIYRQVIINYTPPTNKEQLRNEISAIRNKYQWQNDYITYYDEESRAIEKIRERYGVGYIGSSMRHILDRKHRWEPENLQIVVRIFLYITLILSMLLFTFRHTTTRTFFMSILTSIILTVLTSLVMAFSGFEEEMVYISIIFYFILTLGLSVATFALKKRSLVTGIATNLFMWLLPFVPLCFVALHFQRLKDSDKFDYERDYALQQQYLFFAEVAGILLLLLMVGTYFHKVYRRWYAAPEN